MKQAVLADMYHTFTPNDVAGGQITSIRGVAIIARWASSKNVIRVPLVKPLAILVEVLG